MKKVLTVATIALMMAGTSAFACSGCGCSAKKADSKTECKEGSKDKECDSKKAEKKSSCSSCTKSKA